MSFFLGDALSLAWTLPSSLGWLASESHGSTISSSVHEWAPLCLAFVDSGDQTQVFPTGLDFHIYDLQLLIKPFISTTSLTKSENIFHLSSWLTHKEICYYKKT